MVFAPTALALADVAVVGDELDPLDVLHHRESELGLDPQAQGRSVDNGQRLSIHFIGKNGLRITRRIHVDGAVKAAARGRAGLAARFVVERIQSNVPGRIERPAEFDNIFERDAAPLRDSRPALNTAMLGDLRMPGQPFQVAE